MIKQKGFTLVEIMIAVGILSLVALTATYFVTSAQKQTRKISDASTCNEVADSIHNGLASLGSSLFIDNPQLAGGALVIGPDPAANPGEAFVQNWTPLPILVDNLDGTFSINNFQLIKNPTSALLSVYNAPGLGVNLCPANAPNGVVYAPAQQLVNNSFGTLDNSNATIAIQVVPVNLSNLADDCQATPFTITPIRNVASVLPAEIRQPRTTHGMRLNVIVNYTDGNGRQTGCESSRVYKHSPDTENLTPISPTGVTATMGPLNVANPWAPAVGEVPLIELDAPNPTDFLSCQTHLGVNRGATYRVLNVRLPTDPNSMELGSTLLCRGTEEADPAVDLPPLNPINGPWGFCSNISFPGGGGGAAINTFYDANEEMFVFQISNLPGDKIYGIEVMNLDTALNPIQYKILLSIKNDNTYNFTFTETSGKLNPPVNPWLPSSGANAFDPSQLYQCDNGTTTHRGVVSGPLITKTLTNIVPIDTPCEFGGVLASTPTTATISAGPPVTFTCTATSPNPTPDGLTTASFSVSDQCGNTVAAPAPISPVNWVTMGLRPSLNGFNRDQGGIGTYGDERIDFSPPMMQNQLTTTPPLIDHFQLYCHCKPIPILFPAYGSATPPDYSCPIRTIPTTCFVSGGDSPTAPPNNDPNGQAVATVYDPCTSLADANADPTRTRTEHYCPGPNNFYTLLRCNFNRLPNEVCVANGSDNCWTRNACAGDGSLKNGPGVCCSSLGDWATPVRCCSPANQMYCSVTPNTPCCAAGPNTCPGGAGDTCTSSTPTTPTSTTTTTTLPPCNFDFPGNWGGNPTCDFYDRLYCDNVDVPCCAPDNSPCGAGSCNTDIPTVGSPACNSFGGGYFNDRPTCEITHGVGRCVQDQSYGCWVQCTGGFPPGPTTTTVTSTSTTTTSGSTCLPSDVGPWGDSNSCTQSNRLYCNGAGSEIQCCNDVTGNATCAAAGAGSCGVMSPPSGNLCQNVSTANGILLWDLLTNCEAANGGPGTCVQDANNVCWSQCTGSVAPTTTLPSATTTTVTTTTSPCNMVTEFPTFQQCAGVPGGNPIYDYTSTGLVPGQFCDLVGSCWERTACPGAEVHSQSECESSCAVTCTGSLDACWACPPPPTTTTTVPSCTQSLNQICTTTNGPGLCCSGSLVCRSGVRCCAFTDLGFCNGGTDDGNCCDMSGSGPCESGGGVCLP